MKEINVEICVGTTCFVMGSSKLLELEEMLEEKYKGAVTVTQKACLDLCLDNKYNKSPYVKVNDEVIEEATIEKVLTAIEGQINDK